jgi:ATP-dependent DNA helicase RecQ
MNVSAIDPRVLDVLQRVWGYDALRPLQAEAIAAGVDQRDALVVMPTGGGKSLCYQVPPLVADRTDVVVSPLIALMKDQVDGLRQLGYPAAALHSNLSAAERQATERGIRNGEYKLIFVAPERLVTPWFLETVDRLGIHAIAVDEAHCISQWGHDFRPEYRQLAVLRQRFPGASIHAYTATATPRVRDDIIGQLQLRDPMVLVGTFDRPNLTYRILPQIDRQQQVVEVLRRHAGEASIVYCLSRADTESLAAALRANDIKAEHYHAGMPPEKRRAAQERFASEQTDVIVATIAFGMGIDRSNVRAVVHACLPKSIENYQQETGRAGRDGLPAECVLFYSQGDVMRLERLIQKSAAEAVDQAKAAANVPVQMELLGRMRAFATSAECRHKLLSEYFGQSYVPTDSGGCDACDVCLGEVEGVEDSTVTAQKILSCVARVQQSFGVGHLVEVLVGATTSRIAQFGHDQLSTYGLLRNLPRKAIQSYVYQLLDQGLLSRSEGDRPVLLLNDESWRVMKGQRKVNLVRPKAELARTRGRGVFENEAESDSDVWEGVDRGLFEHLRELRKQIASEQSVPAYVVFNDRTLMELARVRPTTPELFGRIRGVGERKREAYGARMLEAIAAYCNATGLSHDAPAAGLSEQGDKKPARISAARAAAAELFAEGADLDEVARQTGRARSTISQYLVEWIRQTAPVSVSPWVEDATYRRITDAIKPDDGGLKPLYDRLQGEVSYDAIRLVVAHRAAGGG